MLTLFTVAVKTVGNTVFKELPIRKWKEKAKQSKYFRRKGQLWKRAMMMSLNDAVVWLY